MHRATNLLGLRDRSGQQSKGGARLRTVAGICLLALLLLACEVGPTNVPSPPPTPVEVAQVIASYEENPLTARSEFEHEEIQVKGVQRAVGETRNGYYIILESGLYGDFGHVVCETDVFPLTDKGDGLLAWGDLSVDSEKGLVLDNCETISVDNVFSWVLRNTGSHPTMDEISAACRVIRKTGFDEVSDNFVLSDREIDLLIDSVYSLSLEQEDMIFVIPEAIIKTEGPDSEKWCGQWR